jgi:hypothetical protein
MMVNNIHSACHDGVRCAAGTAGYILDTEAIGQQARRNRGGHSNQKSTNAWMDARSAAD